MEKVVVLGAGMAGYGAADKLNQAGVDFDIFEKYGHYGGHCASFTFDDKWTFDDGPHISFTKHDHIRDLFAKNIENDYFEFKAEADNYWKGRWIKHPAQVNLYGLPAEFNTQILTEMIAAGQKQTKHEDIKNYQEWLYASFGKTFAENFPMKYTRKFHTTEASNMSIDWLGPRIYQPKIEEVIHGMLSPVTPDVHYIKGFRYPNKGGFVLAHWDGTAETEQKIKEETKATIRVIPFDAKEEEGKCIYSGKPSKKRVLFAKAY